MKNTKEIKAILTAIYCINLTKWKRKDKDIDLICQYAFNSLFDSNTNLLTLSCVGMTKRKIMKDVKQILFEETSYKDFVEWKKHQEEQRKKQDGTQNI